jgi:glycosyltransferase involved in cell wall biosynthesis
MASKGEGLPGAGHALGPHLKDDEPGQERRVGMSAVIITLNEEHHLGPCLDSLHWVDEIVVVDAGSTDRTIALAKAAGARVWSRDWAGFGPQKNFAFDQARGEWLLVVDADERVSAALAGEIRTRLAAGTLAAHAAYDVPRRNYFFGRWLRCGGAYPDRQVRLVRRGKGRYNDLPLHEHLLVDGSVGRLSGHLVHEAGRTVADRLAKLNRYTDYAAIETLKKRRWVHWWDLLLRPAVIFGKLYILKQGFRDGLAGLIYCGLTSLYEFTKYAKVWERTREGDGSVD